MRTGFRCECCGQTMMLSLHDGTTHTRCPHCGKRKKLPASVAGPAHPQVESDPIDGCPVEKGELVGACAAGDYDPADDAVLTRTMPWVLSALLHLGLAVVMMFLAMLSIPAKAKAPPYVPKAVDTTGETGEMAIGLLGTQELVTEDKPARREERDPGKYQEHESDDKPTIRNAGPRPVDLNQKRGKKDVKIGPPGPKEIEDIFRPIPGPAARADHVVFVIDRSGSMVTTLDSVRLAMYQYIGEMTDKQKFHVILYSSGSGGVKENPPRRLVPANDDEKGALVDFLKDVQAVGQTDPVPALRRAFAVLRAATRTDRKLIYLLSDGEFLENDKVLAAVRSLNPSGPGQAHINTILYGSHPPEAVKVMKLIAKESKGRYKYVSPDE